MTVPGNLSSPLLATAGAAGAAGAGPIKSLRFNGNGNDDPYLERSVSSASNRKTFTFAAWVKNDVKRSNHDRIFSAGTSSTNIFDITLSADSEGTHLRIYNNTGGVNTNWNTINKFVDPAAWFHVVCAIDTTQGSIADRVKVYINGTHITENGTTNTRPSQNADLAVNDAVNHYIGRSGVYGDDRFAGYLADIYFIDGSQLDATSFGAYDDNGVWQSAAYSGTFGTNGFHLLDFANESTVGHDSSGNNNDFTATNITTGPEKATGYVSGTGTPANASGSGGWSQAFDGSTSTLIYNSTNNSTTTFNLHSSLAWTSKIRIYAGQNGTSGTNIIANGTNLSSSHTWPLSGGWQEVTSSLTSPLTSLGLTTVGDQSSNIRAVEIDDTIVVQVAGEDVDVLFDVPTNGDQSDTGAGGEVSGNYPVWDLNNNGGSLTLSNGNLDAANTGGAHNACRATVKFPSTGKWYYEATVTTLGGAACIGVENSTRVDPELAQSGTFFILVNSGGSVQKYNQSGVTSMSGMGTPTVGSILQVAYDADADKVWFGMNNNWMGSGSSANGNPSAGSEASISSVSEPFPVVNLSTSALAVNFGQRSFSYTAPTNFKPLCSALFPAAAVLDGSKYFDTKLYTGNGSTQTVSGLNMSPDLVWLKSRSAADNHSFFDTVRGAQKGFHTNLTAAEFNDPSTLTGFTSDGWTMAGHAVTNASSQSYVGWAWDAGSSNTSSSVASLNSTLYNQSAVWSTMVSPSPSAGTIVSGFDGNLDSVFAGGISAGSYFTFTPTGGISFSDKIRVRNGNVGGASYKYNNGSVTGFPANAWTTVATGGGTMTSFAVTRNTTDVHSWYAIEVDGKILVDQGLTSANTPSIASTIRANQTAGFSIVTYTGNGSIGQRVAHGLSAAPEMIWAKNRDNAIRWAVYHKAVGPGNTLVLNHGGTPTGGTGIWGNTDPTSSVFTISNDSEANTNGDDYVAFCFAPVPGYSIFTSYVGLQSGSSRPFVYCGFRPRWIMIKNYSLSTDWHIIDTERSTFNTAKHLLYPNLADAEYSSDNQIDFFSNGFKVISTTTGMNGSGNNFLVAAFADHPFQANGGLAF